MSLSVNLERLRLHGLYSPAEKLGGLVDASRESAALCGIKIGDYPAFEAKQGDSKDFGMNHAAMLSWACNVPGMVGDVENREALGRFVTTLAGRFGWKVEKPEEVVVEVVAEAAEDEVDEPTELEGETP
jgi:hypothetical protein